MKHIFLYFRWSVFLAVLLTCFSACKKDQLSTYEGESSIYFYNPYYGYGLTYQYDVRDSASIFLGYNTADSLLKLTVKTLGKVQNTDRPYALAIVMDSSTATAGTDYVLTANKVIPANTYSDTITLLLKNRQVSAGTLTLIMQLQANEHFGLPLENARGGYNNKYVWMPYRFKVNLIYDAPKPYYWDANVDYLGAYTPEKIRLMISYFSLPLNTIINNGIVYNTGNIRSDAAKFKKYLKAEAAAGRTIREADGSPMQMGPKS